MTISISILHCKRCRDTNLLKQCECGYCDKVIAARDRYDGREKKFALGHNLTGTGKGSYFAVGEGVIMHTLTPGRNGKRIREHRLVYEQHYNCCLLPYVEIYHKNRINWDNRIGNLQPMYRGQSSNKSRAPTPDRKCIKCGSGTSIRIRNGKEITDWYQSNGGYQCYKCYRHEYRQKPAVKKRKNELDMARYWRTHHRKKPYPGGPSIPANRRCIQCSSHETWINGKGYAEWSVAPGGHLCKKCNERKLRKIPEVNARMRATSRKYRWKPNVKEHRIIRQRERRRDRKYASEIEKTQVALATFAKAADNLNQIENIKLQARQEAEQKRARVNSRRRKWRARRKALGLPAV